MKNTKEKILFTSLNLFNEQGLASVTLRTIAKEMGISQGNLNYHFKKREDIIESLYYNLVQEINVAMVDILEMEVGLNMMKHFSEIMMNSFLKYRFIMVDFAQLMRESHKIKAHFYELSKIREQQFLALFQALQMKGVIREEKLENEYYNLYKRFEILSNFWMSSAVIANKKISKKILVDYKEIITQTIYPYLTIKGVKEYSNLF